MKPASGRFEQINNLWNYILHWFQTSQTGGQQYNDISSFSIPWWKYGQIFNCITSIWWKVFFPLKIVHRMHFLLKIQYNNLCWQYIFCGQYFILPNVLLGVVSSIWPNCRIFIENPLAGKAGRKNDLSITNLYILTNISFIWVKLDLLILYTCKCILGVFLLNLVKLEDSYWVPPGWQSWLKKIAWAWLQLLIFIYLQM